QFAVSAIATTLDDAEKPAARPEPAESEERAFAESPESAVADLETLLSDPAFALAWHCVEARLSPALAIARSAPSLAGVPEEVFIGLLHASAERRPVLSAETAI